MTSATDPPEPKPKKTAGRPEERLAIRQEDAEEALDRFLGKRPPCKAEDEGEENEPEARDEG